MLGQTLRAGLLAVVCATGVALGATSAMADAQRPLVVGMALEPPHLDPTAGAAAAIDEIVYANLFEGLTAIASDGSVVPALATAWPPADDGLSWTFIPRRQHVRRRCCRLFARPRAR